MAVVFTAAHVIADIFRENESKVCLSLGCTDSLGNPQEIDVEKTSAKLEHGILRIEAPKLAAEKEGIKKLTVN